MFDFFIQSSSKESDLSKFFSFEKKLSKEYGSNPLTYLYIKQPRVKLIKSVNFEILFDKK